MKLFKKLAAVALAAVLALTMAGCGGSGSVLMKDELLKLAMDQMTMNGSTATHSKELDALAAKLVQEADKVAGQDAHKGENVKSILTDNDVVQAAGIDITKNAYILNAAPNVQFKSSGTYMELVKMEWMMKAVRSETSGSNKAVKIGAITLGDNVDIGVAMGKIGGKEYVVILYANHAA